MGAATFLSMGDVKANSEEGDGDYSRTNIQVEGVDEADIVKSDGEYIYLATDNRLVIARAYPTKEGSSTLRTGARGVHPRPVHQRRQAGGAGEPLGWPTPTELSAVPIIRYVTKTSVRVYDVTDREHPVLEREVSVDGYYVSSRMIGDYVYLIASWIGLDGQ